MKKSKKVMLAAVVAIAGLAIAAPASAQIPGADAVVSSLNGKLAKYEMMGFVNWWHVPGRFVGGKFRSGEVTVDGKKVRVKSWVKELIPAFNSILSSIPGGYVLQITGHANKPSGTSERALTWLSNKRAAYVHGLFKEMGLTSDKIVHKGVGTSEITAGKDNRRVSFKIVKQ